MLVASFAYDMRIISHDFPTLLGLTKRVFVSCYTEPHSKSFICFSVTMLECVHNVHQYYKREVLSI